jgi:hypothetical protein
MRWLQGQFKSLICGPQLHYLSKEDKNHDEEKQEHTY